MEHHVPDPAIARDWARACNDLVHRVVEPVPGPLRRRSASCRRPRTGRSTTSSRSCAAACVELGFVGCNLNPDPSGGYWTSPPLTDQYWFPLYETLVELDVPAMVHVSASCNPNFHALGAHYLNADTSVFMQLVEGDLFERFPTLRLRHPARRRRGAVPLGPLPRSRRRGSGRPPLGEHCLRNVFFDTCVYHQAGIDLLLEVIAGGQHPVRLRDARRRPRRRPGDRASLGRHEAVPRRVRAH